MPVILAFSTSSKISLLIPPSPNVQSTMFVILEDICKFSSNPVEIEQKIRIGGMPTGKTFF